jgi:hypothetical protein
VWFLGRAAQFFCQAAEPTTCGSFREIMKKKLFNLFRFVMGAFGLIVSKSSNDQSLEMPEH